MKKLLLPSLLSASVSLVAAMPSMAAENLLDNPSFESGPQVVDPIDFYALLFDQVPGWQNFGAYGLFGSYGPNPSIISAPAVGPSDGDWALELSLSTPTTNPFDPNIINYVFQRSDTNPELAASPGEEFYASVEVLREYLPQPGFASGLLGLAFYDAQGAGLEDMSPASISKGIVGDCPFPAANAPESIDTEEELNTWTQLQSQAVTASADTILVDCMVKAPADTASVGFFLFNINTTDNPAPVWFDNAFLARLTPDEDGDRIQNAVDNDPINVSSDFSDGSTFGTVLSDVDSILAIDDSAAPEKGIAIDTDPGNGEAAQLRACSSDPIIELSPGSSLNLTCGSVILDVAEGSAPVKLKIVIDGVPAVLTVPAGNSVTYDDEGGTVEVDETSTGEPVTFTQGDTTISIAPGETLDVPSVQIDIKPGSDENCLNINGRGVIPVALLGSDAFDVSEVDQSSLTFAGLDLGVRGNGRKSCGEEDVNEDGFVDLVCKFEDDASAWAPGSSFATLSGLLNNGDPISGSDSLCIVPKGKKS
jgi:hypothetical protein